MARRIDPTDPGADVIEFLTERHLATLTTHNAKGDLQVTPVGFTYEPERALARVITWSGSIKARNVAANPGSQVAVCQVDGGRWLTVYGSAVVTDSIEAIEQGVTRYAARYRQPKERDDRVVIEISVDRIVGSGQP